MKTKFCSLLFALICCASAQVTIKFSPEPMAVPTAVLANAHSMGRWIIEMCNDGQAPVTLAAERVSMAAPALVLIDSDDAVLVLNSRAQHSIGGTIARFSSLGAQAAALGLALASRSNASWATGLSIGASVIPGVVTIAQGQTPSVVPLLSTIKYPVTLQPGPAGCATDHRFAAKMPKPLPFVVTLTAKP